MVKGGNAKSHIEGHLCNRTDADFSEPPPPEAGLLGRDISCVGGEAFSWMEGTRCNHKDADLSETPSIESNMGRVFDGGLFHTWRVTSTIIQVKHSQPPLDSDPVREGGGGRV